MNIYSVGRRTLDEDWNLREIIQSGKYEWIVYSYDFEGYGGVGDAVLLGQDGLLYTANLEHCSCYEAWDGLAVPKPMTIEEFLRPKESIFDDEFSEELVSKVRELLAQE